MKAMTTESLMATTILLTVVDSEMPMTSSAVTARMARTAGRLMIPVATTTPASLISTPGAAVNAGAMWMPMSFSRLTR